MSCICIAGSNQSVLDLVARVLTTSGMKLLVSDQAQTNAKKDPRNTTRNSVGGLGVSITPQRLRQVMQSARSAELVGWADATNLYSLDEWLRIEPSLCFVLVTEKVAEAVAQAIDDYDNAFDCAQIIRSWQQSQQKLLHFFYRHRDRCILVDSQDCLKYAQDFVRECKQTFSVPLQVSKEPLSVRPLLENFLSVHFSKGLLDSHPEALSLENELATCVYSFSEARVINLEVQQQGAEHLLLSEYRSQRQQAKDSLKHWVEENTTLLIKVEHIEAENQQLFNQYQKNQQQCEILSEEAEADKKTISKLKAELELANTQIAEVRADNHELSKKNEHLFFDLYEAQRGSELSFELNVELEARVTALDTQVNDSRALADLRQVDLDHAFQKNIQLQAKQVEIEAENDSLLGQFQQSLIDLESYILKNRTLQSQLAVEQESTKALESRIYDVTTEYDILDRAHVQWRAERETLLEQIELKQNAMVMQNEESERIAIEHQLQLVSWQEKQSEVEGEIENLSTQLQQSRINLDTYAVEHQVLQDTLSTKNEKIVTLEARLLEVTSEYESISSAHTLWLAERENLLGLHEVMQGELSELKKANAALLLELAEEQMLAERQFSQNENATSMLKALESEKNATEARLIQALQKSPIPVFCERIEVLGSPAGDRLKTQWQVVGLETGQYQLRSLLFSTIIEDSALGLIFSKQQATNNGLIRWPVILATSAELVLSAVGDATTGPIRAETWLSLATTDLDTVVALSLILEQELKEGSISAQLGQSISTQMLKGLQTFKQLSIETQGTFRYDQVRLKRAIVNEDYEHLWFEFDNVRYRHVRLKHFECRVACSELISKRFGSFPKLEFPHLESQQSLDSWFAESHDDFGAKLELRFAPPAVFDTEVWGKLSHDDQGLIFSLLERLPIILREFDLGQAGLHRPWPQWNNVIERMTKSLEPAMTSQSLMDSTHSEPPMIVDQEPVVILNSRPDPLKLGVAGAMTAAKGLATQELTKRPTPSAFLSFLQES